MYGTITKEYTVWCAGIENDVIPFAHQDYLQLGADTKRDFIHAIRRNRWGRIHDVWYCPACLREKGEK